MTLMITTLTAVASAVLMLIYWMNVTKFRAENGISVGDGGSEQLLEKIRVHGNFMEWMPMVLILMGLGESQGASTTALSVAAVLIVFGRIVHPWGMIHDNAGHPARYVGNISSLASVVILTVLLVLTLI